MNETDLDRLLSESVRGARRSDIRELLKLISRPEIIHRAGQPADGPRRLSGVT